MGSWIALRNLPQGAAPRATNTALAARPGLAPDHKGRLSSAIDLRQPCLGVTMQKLDPVEADYLRSDVPEFRPGDTVKVHVKVTEGARSRIQIFQGVVISRRGHGASETFTVRKMSFGVGVERTFPLHSPSVDMVEVVTHGDVRRAKLYYLRDRHGKAAKIKEKIER